MTDLLLGLTAGGMCLVGIIIMVVAWMAPIPKKFGKVFVAIGAVAFLIGAAAYVGLIDTDGDAGGATITESAVYDIMITESDSHVTVDADTNRITMALSFNDTSDAFVSNTGYAELNISLARGDALITDAVATGSLGTVCSVDITGSADEYILDQNADDSFKMKWTKASGSYSYEDCSVLVEAGSSAYVVLNITLNADAVAGMDQYDTCTIDFTIGGEEWTINCIKATVSS